MPVIKLSELETIIRTNELIVEQLIYEIETTIALLNLDVTETKIEILSLVFLLNETDINKDLEKALGTIKTHPHYTAAVSFLNTVVDRLSTKNIKLFSKETQLPTNPTSDLRGLFVLYNFMDLTLINFLKNKN